MPGLSLLGPIPDAVLQSLPLANAHVSAGPPLPTDADLYGEADVKALLGLTTASFLVRVDGDALRNAGIAAGDVLVVDVGAPAEPGLIALVETAGALTAWSCRLDRGALVLDPFHPAHAPLRDRPDAVWGVVTAVVRSLRPAAVGSP